MQGAIVSLVRHLCVLTENCLIVVSFGLCRSSTAKVLVPSSSRVGSLVSKVVEGPALDVSSVILVMVAVSSTSSWLAIEVSSLSLAPTIVEASISTSRPSTVAAVKLTTVSSSHTSISLVEVTSSLAFISMVKVTSSHATISLVEVSSSHTSISLVEVASAHATIMLLAVPTAHAWMVISVVVATIVASPLACLVLPLMVLERCLLTMRSHFLTIASSILAHPWTALFATSSTRLELSLLLSSSVVSLAFKIVSLVSLRASILLIVWPVTSIGLNRSLFLLLIHLQKLHAVCSSLELSDNILIVYFSWQLLLDMSDSPGWLLRASLGNLWLALLILKEGSANELTLNRCRLSHRHWHMHRVGLTLTDAACWHCDWLFFVH